jgi:hypothetical protein
MPAILGRLVLVAVFFLLHSVAASAQQFESWVVGAMDSDEGYYAATVNDSSGVLGQYCYTESGQCLWLIATDVKCEQESKYPVLVNADGGSAETELVCLKLEDKSRYAFADFKKIDDVIRASSSYIGFAFPMASGNFKVSRFLLDGSLKAINTMRIKAEKNVAPKSKPKRSTRDLRL